MSVHFPWSAVLGQERLKLALLLCAIDPAIGGVLVRGPRGVAKTTLARAFAELLPGRFVELPLGATEERVTGTLDLGKVLQHGQVEFSPGLLARAHQGVLYVDEVNLLPDALVDLLLDAAASGSNVVERDGVSHTHPARFVLMGTMNPEEGELRAQFVDRFGLSVTADGELPPAERAQIVLRRLEFEQAPERFVAHFEAEQRLLRERCAQARERASALEFTGPGLARVAELCHAARVEGVRADLAMLRAARAHAVWQGRDAIEVVDVDAVAELALAHRRRTPEPPAAPRGSAGSGAAPPASGSPARGAVSSPPAKSASGSAASGDAGALPPVPVRAQAMTLPRSWPSSPARAPRGEAVPGRPGARRLRRHGTRIVPGSIDWFSTLLRAPRPTTSDLRRRPRTVAAQRLWLIVLDCSGSMLRSGALARAKGVAAALTAQAATRGARVALISFAGATVSARLGARPDGLTHAIAELGGGGGTPLRSALVQALAVCKGPAYRECTVEKRVLLLTDGRTRESVSDLRGSCVALGLRVVDCERGPLRLGHARQLATALGAEYSHLDALG
jgi:magnesium chelatase subunit D